MAKLTASISIRHMPEVLASMRHEIATALINAAAQESSPLVRRRLEEIAAEFEIGQTIGKERRTRKR